MSSRKWDWGTSIERPYSYDTQRNYGHRGYFCVHKDKGAPSPATLQYWVNAWSEGSKLLYRLPWAKMHLLCSPLIEDISDIKLIRTDTTLDLSQMAEKRWHTTACDSRATVLTVPSTSGLT